MKTRLIIYTLIDFKDNFTYNLDINKWAKLLKDNDAKLKGLHYSSRKIASCQHSHLLGVFFILYFNVKRGKHEKKNEKYCSFDYPILSSFSFFCIVYSYQS